MLDPVKNAKSLGVIFLIGALLGSFGLLLTLRLGTPLVIAISVLSTIFGYAVAIGLIIVKRWSIYALGLLILVQIPSPITDFTAGRPPELLEIILLIIQIFAFFWFYSARARFN